MKKKIVMALLACMISSSLILTSCGQNAKSVTTSDKSTEKKNSFSEDDIKDVITGLEDHYILQDAADIDYLYGVTYDKDIVKKVVQLCEKYDRKLYGVVSNMSIAMERRDLLQKFDCFICNQQEAGMFFSDDYSEKGQEELQEILADCLKNGNIPSMVVTMGGKGSVYADCEGLRGFCPPKNVSVKDTTGAGDSFCAGVASGLTYGKTLPEAVEIGTRLAASVITSSENVCPRFLPAEFGLEM